MQSLEFQYRVVALCSAYMGWTAQRPYDSMSFLVKGVIEKFTAVLVELINRVDISQDVLEYPYTLNCSAFTYWTNFGGNS